MPRALVGPLVAVSTVAALVAGRAHGALIVGAAGYAAIAAGLAACATAGSSKKKTDIDQLQIAWSVIESL